MTYIDGVKLNDRQQILDLHYDKKLIAARISKALFQQILSDGYFHGDPHPGNSFILSGGRIAFVDFGVVGTLSPVMKRRFANLIYALTRRNTKTMVVKAILQLDVVPKDVDLERLHQDIDRLRMKHLDVAIGEISFPDLVNDLLDTAMHHRIEVALLTLKGIVHELDPTMSFLELAKPFRISADQRSILCL